MIDVGLDVALNSFAICVIDDEAGSFGKERPRRMRRRSRTISSHWSVRSKGLASRQDRSLSG